MLLVVVDLLDAAYTRNRRSSDLEGDAAISMLLAEGALLDAAVMFLASERSKIPSGCQSVIEVERTTPASNSRLAGFERLHFRYAETGVNTYRYVGEADAVSNPAEMADLARGWPTSTCARASARTYPARCPSWTSWATTRCSPRADAWRRWQVRRPVGDWLRARSA